MDPYRELAVMLEEQSKKHTIRIASAQIPELGYIAKVSPKEDPVELLQGGDFILDLDRFDKLIKNGEYMTLMWEHLRIRIPRKSRVVRIASPVDECGNDIPGVTKYSDLSRIDFEVKGEEGPDVIREVEVRFQESIRRGKGNPTRRDRVLVIPVNDGREFVVVGQVVKVADEGTLAFEEDVMDELCK